MTVSDIEVPDSLEVLDIVGNGMACERFLWIRGLSDRSLEPKSRVDLIDDLQRLPGELLHVASSDGTAAATMFTIRDETGAGSCYMSVFSRLDPGEPVLGDLVTLASARAHAGGLAQVGCGDVGDRPHMTALRERHGFVEFERWRRFHVDVANAPVSARLPGGVLPDGVRVATLAERPDLAEAAYEVSFTGLDDTVGDFPRPETTLQTWLGAFDSSPVQGRDLVFMLLGDDDEVLAFVELRRRAMGSDRAWVEFLTIAREHRGRGLARIAKQYAVEFAREQRITQLHTVNHEHNVAIRALNQQLGWTEDPPRVALQRDAGSR